MRLSVVIPCAHGDNNIDGVLNDLVPLKGDCEVLVVSPQPVVVRSGLQVRQIQGNGRRADQLNLGGEHAQGEFLWFLHADSHLTPGVIEDLKLGLTSEPDGFHYFALKFRNDGPNLTKLNGFGARWRSRFLKLPFGDQGFALRKDTWLRLGKFPTDRTYGEDHSLVWRSKEQGLKFSYHSSAIETSARKYKNKGWLKTTVIHGFLTWKQVVEELVGLKSNKSFREPEN